MAAPADTRGSSEHVHHVTLRLARDYEFVARFDDVPHQPSLVLDEPEPIGHGSAPNAAAVLGAAVGNCLAASLTFCLRKSRVDLTGLTAHVATRVVRNAQGRFRIAGIDVELAPEVADVARLTRCEGIFEDFCVVTESVRHGIPVTVNVSAAQPRTVEASG